MTTSASAARLAGSGLVDGALNALSQSLNIGFSSQSFNKVSPEDDWRVRVSCAPLFPGLYNDASNLLMKPLAQSSGVIFPYTPQVTVTHTARYGSAQLTHSNYAAYFYEGSEVGAIQISGEFTVQNVLEGQYFLAALYFFRSCTKMFFGLDQNAGKPPPLLFLDGYGSHYFPHVPCVLTSLQHTMPNDVDYVDFPVDTSLLAFINSNYTNGRLVNISRLPTTSTVTITLQPVYSRTNIHNNFTFTGFSQGNLLGGAQSISGIPGGFI